MRTSIPKFHIIWDTGNYPEKKTMSHEGDVSIVKLSSSGMIIGIQVLYYNVYKYYSKKINKVSVEAESTKSPVRTERAQVDSDSRRTDTNTDK